MTVREVIYGVIAADASSLAPEAIAAQGVSVDDVWNIEAADNPDRRKPFLVIAWASQPTSPGTWATDRRRDLLVWAHDDSADYLRIDRILDRVKDILGAIIHQDGVSQVQYTGASPDLYDGGFRTITRNYGFRVIGAD